MPYCLKCGRNVEDNDFYCSRCLQKAEADMQNEQGKSSCRLWACSWKFISITSFLLIFCPLLALWMIYSDTETRSITVPDCFPTIQEAIVGAETGEMIIVKPGVYCENIDFLGKDVTLCSTDPQKPDVVASTIIQGNGTEATVCFRRGESSRTMLQGLTIAGCDLANERSASHETIPGSLPAAAAGCVIFVAEGSSPLIKDNIITAGKADRGGAVHINNASPSIINNIIKGNRAHWEGGAFYIGVGAKPVIRDNTITDNSAEDGGGIYVLNAAPLVCENRIRENSALYQGGGIMIRGGEPEVTGNKFEQNKAGECGGAAVLLEASPLLRENIFIANEGGWRGGGAIYVGLRAAPQLVENTFTQNEAVQGKDIWVSADSSLPAGPHVDRQLRKEADVYYQE